MDHLWADTIKRLRGIGCEPTESWEDASTSCCRNGCARVSKPVDPDAELLGQAERRAYEGRGRRAAPNSFSPNAFTSVPIIPDHALAGQREPDRFLETTTAPSASHVQGGFRAQSGGQEPNLFGRPLPALPERPGAFSCAFLESADAVPLSSLRDANKARKDLAIMVAASSETNKSTSGSDASTVRSASMTNYTSFDSCSRGDGYSTHQISGAARVHYDNIGTLELDTAGCAFPGFLHSTCTSSSAMPHDGYDDDLPSLSPPSTRSPGTPSPHFAGMLFPSHQDTDPVSKGFEKRAASAAEYSNLPPTALYILGSEDVALSELGPQKYAFSSSARF